MRYEQWILQQFQEKIRWSENQQRKMIYIQKIPYNLWVKKIFLLLYHCTVVINPFCPEIRRFFAISLSKSWCFSFPFWSMKIENGRQNPRSRDHNRNWRTMYKTRSETLFIVWITCPLHIAFEITMSKKKMHL